MGASSIDQVHRDGSTSPRHMLLGARMRQRSGRLIQPRRLTSSMHNDNSHRIPSQGEFSDPPDQAPREGDGAMREGYQSGTAGSPAGNGSTVLQGRRWPRLRYSFPLQGGPHMPRFHCSSSVCLQRYLQAPARGLATAAVDMWSHH